MFQFNLQPLLIHRKFKEKILKKELAETERMLDRERRTLARQQDDAVRICDEMACKSEQNTTVFELHCYVRSHQRLVKQMADQRQVVRTARQRSDEKRNRLIEAMKKRKAVDRLKEKKWRQYQKAVARKEQAFNSEMAIQRYHRKS